MIGHLRPPARRCLLWLGALGAATVSLTGCDPCFGVAGCLSGPRLSLGGQIIVYQTGQPVPGVALDFIRTGGISLDRDSVRVTTDGDGRFQIAVGASEAGEVEAEIAVRPPSALPEYRVRGVRFRTSDVRGEGTELGRWVVEPYLAFVGELKNRRTGSRLAHAWVQLRRTGGVEIIPDIFSVQADTDGRFYAEFRAREPGPVVVDLIVSSAALPRTFRWPDVRLAASHVDRVVEVAGVWRIGPSLDYVGEVLRADTDRPVADVEIEYRRTGGIAVSPDVFVDRSNSVGRFLLSPMPQEDGTVIGDLFIRPPPPLRDTVFTGVRLETFEGDELRLRDVWRIAPPR